MDVIKRMKLNNYKYSVTMALISGSISGADMNRVSSDTFVLPRHPTGII